MMRGMKRCAYLVMEDPGDFVTDYDLSFDAMAELGWQIDCVPWRDTSVDWNAFDAVYICTPWDYPDDPDCLHPTNPSELPEPGIGVPLALGTLALAARTRRSAYSSRSTL